MVARKATKTAKLFNLENSQYSVYAVLFGSDLNLAFGQFFVCPPDLNNAGIVL